VAILLDAQLTTCRKLLNFLLSGEDPDTVVENIHEYLRNLTKKMREFAIPVQKYTIYTQLGKDPKDYPNGNSMPSVQVALRQIAKGKHVKAKDVMSFVITGESSGSAEAAAKNAFTLEDIMKKDSDLKPDIDYYLHKQILPPVERLCAPISGTNVTRLAECLGLDTSKYRVSTVSGAGNADVEIHPLESQIPDSVRFKDATPLQLRCRHCTQSFVFEGLLQTPGMVSAEGVMCQNSACAKPLSTLSIAAQVEAQIRQSTARYYNAWLVCDDPACAARTRQMSVYGSRCLGPKNLAQGCMGRMHYEYTEKDMYNQLLYFQNMFDVDRAMDKISKQAAGSESSEKVGVLAELNRDRFETVKDVVKGYLDKNGRQWVAMDTLFAFALKAM